MILIGLKVTFVILDSYSLKDKRSVVKSMINRMRGKYNISIAEIEDNDLLNKGVVGLGVVGNNRSLCRQVLERVMTDIEEQYEIEIQSVEELEGYWQLYKFLNSVGVQFLKVLKTRLKVDKLLNPDCKDTSVMERLGLSNSNSACEMRFWLT